LLKCHEDPKHRPSLRPCSAFPESKEQDPDFPSKNGGVAGGAIELKRPAGAHCHGAKAAGREDGGAARLLARKKLYIASAVCLVFMIGEVIGTKIKAQSLLGGKTAAQDGRCINYKKL